MEPEPEPASGLTRTPTPHPPSAPSQAADDEYHTCLDREFVQKEIGWARQYGKKIIVIYEKEDRRAGFFDFGKARAKYAGTPMEFILDIDAEPYQRDEVYAEGMMGKIVQKAAGIAKVVPVSEPMNAPGSWDGFLSHAQASGGDQTQTMQLRLKNKGWDVWYDNAMLDRSTAAMEEGVKHSRCFVLFLTGDGTAAPPSPAPPAAASTVPEDVPPQPLLEAGREQIDFSAPIGRGGFADVFLGVYRFVAQSDPTPVAFKLFRDSLSVPPAMKERIQKEARIGLQLDHPHLIQFHGLLEVPRRGMALVLQLATGGALRTVLSDTERHPVLSWSLRLRWLVGISEGVAKLHSLTPQPVIHRDLKTANVLLCGRELATAVPKVCDFGVATIIQQTAASVTSAGAGNAGTLAWQAPEQFSGKVSPASDIFGLAVTDYEIFTRQLPWAGLTPAEITKKVSETFDPTDRRVLRRMEKRGESIEQQREDWLEDFPLEERRPDLAAVEVGCPPELLELTKRCWADDPAERPSLRERLGEFRSISAQLEMEPELAALIGPDIAWDEAAIANQQQASAERYFRKWVMLTVEFRAARGSAAQVEAEYQLIRFKQLLKGWEYMRKQKCFRSWNNSVQELGRKRRLIKRCVARIQNRQMFSAMCIWADYVAERKRMRTAAYRVAKLLMNRLLHAAFAGWAESTGAISDIR
eukprot:COSAG02_NODE_8453_length_2567_cov_2.266613_1_plen_696_part_00